MLQAGAPLSEIGQVDEDVAALVMAAQSLSSHLRVLTYQTLIPLLAVTGMRVGEAIRLDRNDLDFEHERKGCAVSFPAQPGRDPSPADIRHG